MLFCIEVRTRSHMQQEKGIIVARLQIRDIAQSQNLNRSQLQMKAGITMPLLNRYWNNKTRSVNLEALSKIARALGVRVRDLFTDNEEQ